MGKRAGGRVGAAASCRADGPAGGHRGGREGPGDPARTRRSPSAPHQAVPVLPITNRRVRGRLPAPITNARDAREGRWRSTGSGLLQKCSSRSPEGDSARPDVASRKHGGRRLVEAGCEGKTRRSDRKTAEWRPGERTSMSDVPLGRQAPASATRSLRHGKKAGARSRRAPGLDAANVRDAAKAPRRMGEDASRSGGGPLAPPSADRDDSRQSQAHQHHAGRLGDHLVGHRGEPGPGQELTGTVEGGREVRIDVPGGPREGTG